MTPLEKLLAETIPTGTFGHALPPRPAPRPTPSWTPAEQAAHWDELGRALGEPHLRLVHDADDETAA